MHSGTSGSLCFSLWRAFMLCLLIIGCRSDNTTCTTRRCLAKALMKRNLKPQPQDPTCLHPVEAFVDYQTIAVDTKKLRLIAMIKADMVWNDPELKWNRSVYPFDQVVLPVDKIWKPEIRVTNGISTTTQHGSHDLVADFNGTVFHSEIIYTEVNCEVNLFNYPFASDECPLALETFMHSGCGAELSIIGVGVLGGAQGDWQTDNAALEEYGNGYNYIRIALSIKHLNPFITLMLPSILLMMADVVSFALPLGGGERNSFKVTLVLSFTMFLIILNDELPGVTACSPIIRTHFCICLVLMVFSMLVSMILTRVAKEGGLIFGCSKCRPAENEASKEEVLAEARGDISVVQVNSTSNEESLKKVLKFLEASEAQDADTAKKEAFANKLDKIFFWFYFIATSCYFCGMITVMVHYDCDVNHFDFLKD
ncbi:5-hydroxytryptamine receptor 3A-like isoform X1 [Synchiropus splendidus]|uniref:5-hydroxytryptamine receptor 3A-like isoform X1 n=2 Tax=Synchiropus splendidus TaxID=270530 RepID=UPI00237D722D|nr:5-hydroxytryptamine receptor 3A-like isoform X1 [Synchiropus splendidus]